MVWGCPSTKNLNGCLEPWTSKLFKPRLILFCLTTASWISSPFCYLVSVSSPHTALWNRAVKGLGSINASITYSMYEGILNIPIQHAGYSYLVLEMTNMDKAHLKQIPGHYITCYRQVTKRQLAYRDEFPFEMPSGWVVGYLWHLNCTMSICAGKVHCPLPLTFIERTHILFHHFLVYSSNITGVCQLVQPRGGHD